MPCKCSLGQPNEPKGFCGSIIGTDEYKKALGALSKVLTASKCHTLDRDDFRAQKDQCGIGTSNDVWRFAVDKMFNVTYWPYIRISTVYTCTSQFFGDSWYNLNLDNALLIPLSFALVSIFSIGVVSL